MTSEQGMRASLHPSRHGLVDVELKALKIHSRRLQALLAIHETELQVLQRLYYKNKNQHRGALFWRNVSEIRRFLERLNNLHLLDSINRLRSMFYDTTQNPNAIKGSWTHYPTEKTLIKFMEHYKIGVKLMEKMSERCLIAYRSFHRSLQSAAFLQILLMFVAIASRTRTLATELHDLLHQIILCTNKLVSITIEGGQCVKDENCLQSFNPQQQRMDLDVSDLLHISPLIAHISMQQRTAPSIPEIGSTTRKPASGPITVEKTVVYQTRIPPKQPPKPAPVAKKKQRKVPKDEIDDIFGC